MRLVLLLSCVFISSCVVKVRSLQVESVEAQQGDSFLVESPVKAHLVDGSVVIFDKGMSVLNDEIIGEGYRYDLKLQRQQQVTSIKLADVAAMESFQTPLNSGATAAATTGATAGGGAAGLGLLKLVFGSCPTTYSLAGDEPVLEAESFSYAIAPGFESLDIDRLGIATDTRGIVALEMRNEALETHYINQVELLAVPHAAHESVFTDAKRRPLVVHSLRPPVSATDNSGLHVEEVLAVADGDAWRASNERLQQVSTADFNDSLILTFDSPLDAPAALVLRLRNSLLNTVLLYDVMLAGQGFRALDWMGRDLTRLKDRWQLARWYRNTMGLHVAVREGERWREVASFDDTGPIAWKDIAVALPRTRNKTITVRLSFVSDNWRIDQASLATLARVAKFETVPLLQITDALDARHLAAERDLAADDKHYVITQPGEHFRLAFDADALATEDRTFFLSARGYYIEWMRRDWLQTSTTAAFEPNDAALVAALTRWRSQRETMRAQFDATRINVR
ncbi:MAG: hypothetical protein WBM68_09680 [Woeseia sp.]